MVSGMVKITAAVRLTQGGTSAHCFPMPTQSLSIVVCMSVEGSIFSFLSITFVCGILFLFRIYYNQTASG
jgi:hypothetical protein